MTNTYTSYHTNLKLCFSLGIENQIFPKEFLEKIPKTTSQYWKTKKTVDFCGSEFEEITQCTLEELKIISDRRSQHARRIFVSFLRVYFAMIQILGEQKFKSWICKQNFQSKLSDIFVNFVLIIKLFYCLVISSTKVPTIMYKNIMIF